MCYLLLLLRGGGIRLWRARRLASFCVLGEGDTGVRWCVYFSIGFFQRMLKFDYQKARTWYLSILFHGGGIWLLCVRFSVWLSGGRCKRRPALFCVRWGGGTVVQWCVGKERRKYVILLLLLLLLWGGQCRKEFETVLSEDVKCVHFWCIVAMVYCCMCVYLAKEWLKRKDCMV